MPNTPIVTVVAIIEALSKDEQRHVRNRRYFVCPYTEKTKQFNTQLK
jgi:hypothetical protein